MDGPVTLVERLLKAKAVPSPHDPAVLLFVAEDGNVQNVVRWPRELLARSEEKEVTRVARLIADQFRRGHVVAAKVKPLGTLGGQVKLTWVILGPEIDACW